MCEPIEILTKRIPKWKRDMQRQMVANARTIMAKQALESLIIGQKIKIKKKKRSYIVDIIAKNNRIITVRMGNGRLETVHFSEIVTRETKIQRIGA